LIVILIFYFIHVYNVLVRLRQKKEEAWSGIFVQLKRRRDLIPNLVNTVKGYVAHESETLENVIKARQQAINIPKNGKLKDIAASENMLSQTLRSIFALSENYPDLKANQNFLKLQEEITETEDQITASRRIYNSNVQLYNTQCESFPSNIIAQKYHFEKADYFELDEAEKKVAQEVPAVNF
jgi:LemA protein